MNIRDSEVEIDLKEFENSEGFKICKKMLNFDVNYVYPWNSAYEIPVEVVRLYNLTRSSSMLYYYFRINHLEGDYEDLSNREIFEARYFFKSPYQNSDNNFIMSEFYEKIDGQWKIIGITYDFIDSNMKITSYEKNCYEDYCINGCSDDVKTDCGLFVLC